MMPCARHAPLSTRRCFAGLSGDIAVSFEFFPPKTERDGCPALEPRSPQLAPTRSPAFVSVTYGAGRVDTRTHPRDRRPDHFRSQAARCGTPDLRRCNAGQKSGKSPSTTGRPACGTSSHYAAMLASRALHSSHTPTALKTLPHLLHGPEAKSHRLKYRWPPIPRPIPDAVRSAEADIDNLKRKLDAGATPRDHPVLLRPGEPTSAFAMQAGLRTRIDDIRYSRASCPSPTSRKHASSRPPAGARNPPVDGWAFRRPRRTSRDAPAGRGDYRCRIHASPSLCRRSPGFPLLHPQPRRARIRNLPHARA